jgi:hypothetical protein
MPSGAGGGGGPVDGSIITTWQDSSGNGHTANKTGSPIIKLNVLNGKPVVRLRSASSDGFNLATSIPNSAPWTAFFVVKRNTASDFIMTLMSATAWGTGGIDGTSSNFYAASSFYTTSIAAVTVGDTNSGFHIYTVQHATGALAYHYKDGTFMANGGSGSNVDPYITLGYIGTQFSNGDIAELILYSSALALRLKLTLLITTLLVTGQFPGTEEFDAMVGDRAKIRRYLHRHGAHPTQEQLDAVVEPFAVGDRANIEKGLSTKYGIAVTSGGTAVDPSTVAGMLGWWKADSL